MRYFIKSGHWTKIRKALALALLSAAASFDASAAGTPDALPKAALKRPALPGEGAALAWQDDLDAAFATALSSHKPVLALFSSPDCGWCSKMKSESLSKDEVAKLLENFLLVEIDVTQKPAKGAEYQIRGVPTILIFAGDGRMLDGAAGYVQASDMIALLKRTLNPEFLKKLDGEHLEQLRTLMKGKADAKTLASLMIALGAKERRKGVHDAIMALTPFPKEDMLALLDSPYLAVRLGALELLEERAGDGFGFDPWLSPKGKANDPAQAKWKAWAGTKDTARANGYQAFSPEQTAAYIRDLISPDNEVSRRALMMLEHGGAETAKELALFLEERPTIPKGAKGKIKAAQYTLLLQPANDTQPSVLAFNLVFGTQDMKIKTMETLSRAGGNALPVLKDFLDDADSIIRESAADAIAKARGRASIPLFAALLEREKDANVAYAVVRNLGDIRSERGLKMLVARIGDQNEDIAVAALCGIKKLGAKKASPDVVKALCDPRWRVRAAALETVEALAPKSAEAKAEVSKLLDDKDEFVRVSAVKALAKLAPESPRFEELFMKDDQLKGPIMSAIVSANKDVKLSAAFAKAIEGKDADTLLPVVSALEDAKSFDLLLKLSSNKDEDVSCAALRILAEKGTADEKTRGRLIQALGSSSEAQVAAVIENLRFTRDDDFGLDNEDSATEEPEAETADDSMKDILDAFSSGDAQKTDKPKSAAKPATRQETPAAATIDDVAAAFGAEPETAKEEIATPGRRGSMKALLEAVARHARPESPESIRLQAMLALASNGDEKAIDGISANLQAYTSSQKERIAKGLGSSASKKSSIAFLKRLLKDSSEEVRHSALHALCSKNKRERRDAIFSELLASNGKLTAWDVVKTCSPSSFNKANSGKWLESILDGSRPCSREIKIAALYLMRECKGLATESLLVRHMESESQWLRFAAFYALGKGNQQTFRKFIPKILDDPSPFVRLALPLTYERGSVQFAFHLDDKNSVNSYDWTGRHERKALPPEVKEALGKLADDPDSNVRLESFFALMSNNAPFDIAKLIDTVDSLPERKSAQGKIAEYMRENYKRLGPEFKLLLPYLAEDKSDSEESEKVYKHFNVNQDALDDASVASVADAVKAKDARAKHLQASFLPVAEEPVRQPDAGARLKLLFFFKPGCQDCERVSQMLAGLPSVYPNLDIETHNIRKQDAMRLNEALCDRFGVPQESRLVAPSVFCGAGALIKTDIEMERLCALLAKSAGLGPDVWREVSAAELAGAGDKIERRFAEVKTAIIALAGLLDGVNPCAFATIVFLLSYLRVARRTPGELARIGAAFVSGVFLAYLLLGLGLVELISRLTFLRDIGMILNWALAAFCLLIMILSLRDGVLCLRGRLKDTALQLPGFLKRWTHASIRTGARHIHFIIAAFAIGVAISFLELACTGQVYAPTIMYIIQEGGNSMLAFSYLLIYNLAFIAPLLAIFALSYFGMTSDMLAAFMVKNAAMVKFATALLFLAIFLAFVFGERILPKREGAGQAPSYAMPAVKRPQ